MIFLKIIKGIGVMIIYEDIKSAMRFLNNANQEVIARNNKFYNKKGECIAIVNLPKKK